MLSLFVKSSITLDTTLSRSVLLPTMTMGVSGPFVLITRSLPQNLHLELFGLSHRVHRVATAAFWCTFSHKGNICPGWWGWGVHAHPLSLHLPSSVKLQCTLQLSGQIHWPCFISSIDMYSVGSSTCPSTECTLLTHYTYHQVPGTELTLGTYWAHQHVQAQNVHSEFIIPITGGGSFSQKIE